MIEISEEFVKEIKRILKDNNENKNETRKNKKEEEKETENDA